MGERFFDLVAEAYKTWNTELIGFLSRQLKRSPDTAQDIAQEAFTKWLAAQRSAAPPEKPRAYLYEIARNLLCDHWRKENIRNKYIVASLDDQNFAAPTELYANTAQPEAQADTMQRLRLLQAAIDTLPPRQREAFLLYRYDELSCAEIAQHMGISVRAVEKHLQLALAHCKRSLHDTAS